MATWVLIIMLYNGDFVSHSFPTRGTCNAAMLAVTIKHVKTLECVAEMEYTLELLK